MHDINQFATYLADHLFDGHPEMKENHTVTVKETTKLNGVKLIGLQVSETDSNIAPIMYVNSSFSKYQQGEDIDDIVHEYFDIYRNSRPESDFSIDFFEDFEQVKDRLMMKIINRDMNVDLLGNVPHYILGDLAIIFQVVLASNFHGTATITIRNEHLSMWKVTAAELFEYAKSNAEEKYPVRIRSMLDTLQELMSDLPEGIEDMGDDSYMYILTNEQKNSASGIIFTEKLQEFAEQRNANFWILPSSVFELILVPDNGSISVQELENMVKEVNSTSLSPDEVLSDKVYYYDKNVKQLMFAETREAIELIAC